MSRATGQTSKKLSRSVICDAAIKLVQQKGVDFSMRDLARDLGVAPMAAYRHYPSRDDLISDVVERALGDILDEKLEQALAADEQPWQDRMVIFGMLAYDRLIQYPGISQELALGTAITPNTTKLITLLAGFFVKQGFAFPEAVKMVQTATTYILQMASLDYQMFLGRTKPERLEDLALKQSALDQKAEQTLVAMLSMSIRDRAEYGLRLMCGGVKLK